MVRTKKQAIASVNSSQAIQPSTKHGNVDHSLPWNLNDQLGCQKDRSHEMKMNEYVHRERDRKTQKIMSSFGQLSQEEIDVMLMDCGCNEDEVIKRLQNRPDYLQGIRHIMSTVFLPAVEKSSETILPSTAPRIQHIQQQPAPQPIMPQPTPVYQPVVSQPVVTPYPQNSSSPISESTAALFKRDSKKRSRMTGRLGLDDALKQIKAGPNNAFEGWSQARVRAFQMIEQNPNSYYYRFNAPGEEQRKGAWTADEKELFFARLREVGANGQWGIFSTAIPGRVGYQCSNYYRLLIESGQLQDPNYIVDEKGKAHYLFDKRGSDGRVEKTFRTHSPHTFGNKQKSPSSTAKKKVNSDDDGDTSGTFSISLRSSARIAAKNHTRSKTVP